MSREGGVYPCGCGGRDSGGRGTAVERGWADSEAPALEGMGSKQHPLEDGTRGLCGVWGWRSDRCVCASVHVCVYACVCMFIYVYLCVHV